jgi:glyoxylase-like metal-dependent hydrolase (beta-lactamase superfamily II)
VQRLTAPNPGMMTGPGTNSYVIGDADSGFIVIDPGPPDREHIQRLWQACGGDLRFIVCTHSHPDHSPGAALLKKLCAQNGVNVRIMGMASADTARAHSRFVPDHALHDGDRLVLHSGQDTHTLRVVHTPGHAANHLCFMLEEDGLLISGDHILNGSTTVIDPPDGNMADYLVPMAAEMPDIIVAHIQTPTKSSMLGAKGAGEAGTAGAPGAVINAINDALAPFNVYSFDQPLTPEKVLKALGTL